MAYNGQNPKMNFLKLTLFAALLFSLVSCATSKADPVQYQRQWMLISFKDYPREELIKNKAQLDLSATKSPHNQYSAFAGCNRMFFTAQFSANGKVKISNVGSTLMACENGMKLESDFGQELTKMTQYKIEGHLLTLMNGKGSEMKFVAADWD